MAEEKGETLWPPKFPGQKDPMTMDEAGRLAADLDSPCQFLRAIEGEFLDWKGGSHDMTHGSAPVWQVLSSARALRWPPEKTLGALALIMCIAHRERFKEYADLAMALPPKGFVITDGPLGKGPAAVSFKSNP